MVEKYIIIKSIDDAVNKCSRTTLTSKDKEFIENFKKNKETYGDDLHADGLPNWKRCEEEQSKTVYPAREADAVAYWGYDGYDYINGKIYKTDLYKESLDEGLCNIDTINTHTKNLQSAIDNSPRIPINVVTHRIGHWESGHKEGDVVVQKGFASTSFTGGIDIRSGEYAYEIDYYISTGTKGLLLSDEQFNCLDEEELLLGQKTRQYVLEQDDDLRKVSVLILPDRD